MYIDELIKSTNAYKIISGEKKRGALSHAYLIVCPDADFLREYLKVFARLIACSNDGCGACRTCKLISEEGYTDCTFYPKDGAKILTADVDDLLSQVNVKPLENRGINPVIGVGCRHQLTANSKVRGLRIYNTFCRCTLRKSSYG